MKQKLSLVLLGAILVVPIFHIAHCQLVQDGDDDVNTTTSPTTTYIQIHSDHSNTTSDHHPGSSETEEATTTKEKVNCVQGLGFPSLQACTDACFEEANDVSMEGSKTYKIIWIDPSSSSDMDNIIKKFPGAMSRQGMYGLCYPLDPAFIKCSGKWAVLEHEYTYDNSTHTLWVKSDDRRKNMGEFYTAFYEENRTMAVECTVPSPPQTKHLVASIVSLISLMVCIILNAFFKDLETRKNVLLQCHIVTMTFGFCVLTVRLASVESSGTVCLATGILQQYFFLSAFFLMSAQALDICLSVRGHQVKSERKKTRRLTFYILACFGMPAVISGVTLMAELMPIEVINPEIRIHCWFKFGLWNAFYYHHGWMALSLAFNLLMFLIIVVTFHRISKTVESANKGIHVQLFKVCVKLVVVMGFTWIFKIIIWAKGNSYDVPWLWYLDALSHLAGLFVLLVYFCTRQTCRQVSRSCSFDPKRVDSKETTSTSSNATVPPAHTTSYPNPAFSASSENLQNLNRVSDAIQHM